jgi:hypothetical protein
MTTVSSAPEHAVREFTSTSGGTVAANRSENSDLFLSLDAFVRSVGVRRNTPHALFLGAGASVSSGLPSAQACIWEWKRRTPWPSVKQQQSRADHLFHRVNRCWQ